MSIYIYNMIYTYDKLPTHDMPERNTKQLFSRVWVLTVLLALPRSEVRHPPAKSTANPTNLFDPFPWTLSSPLSSPLVSQGPLRAPGPLRRSGALTQAPTASGATSRCPWERGCGGFTGTRPPVLFQGRVSKADRSVEFLETFNSEGGVRKTRLSWRTMLLSDRSE